MPSQLSDDFGLCSASALAAARRGSLGQRNSDLAAAVLQRFADQEHCTTKHLLAY